MKKLLLISAALIAAPSAVNASENSGNIRAHIIAQAALEAPFMQKQMEKLQDSVELRKWLQDTQVFDVVPAEPTAAVADVAADVKPSGFLNWLQSHRTKASDYVRPYIVRAQNWMNGLALGDKFVDAQSYVQTKYAAATNSGITKKVSDYTNQGIELVKENPKTAVALVVGTTAIAVTAWLVKKLYSDPAKNTVQHTQKNDIKVSVPNEVVNYVVTTEIVSEPAAPVASLYPTEDMESYAEFVKERDSIEGSIPSVYPRIN